MDIGAALLPQDGLPLEQQVARLQALLELRPGVLDYLSILEDVSGRITSTFHHLLDQLIKGKKALRKAHLNGINFCNPPKENESGLRCSLRSKDR